MARTGYMGLREKKKEKEPDEASRAEYSEVVRTHGEERRGEERRTLTYHEIIQSGGAVNPKGWADQ